MTSARLRFLLNQGQLIEMPLAFDAMSALLSERMGFPAVLVGGGGLSHFEFGVPDLGLVSIPEFCQSIARIASVVDIPLVADLDDCGGNTANVFRSVRLAERAGASAVMIEDLLSAGKHRPDAGEQVRSQREAVSAITAAVEARRNPDTVIIGRTDLLLTSPLEEAISRANMLVQAGADVAFLTHLPMDSCKQVAAQIHGPVLYTMKTIATPAERAQLAADSIRAVIYSEVLRESAFVAMRDALINGRPELAPVNARELGPAELVTEDAWGQRFSF